MSDWSKKLEAAMILAPSVVGGLMASEPMQTPDISTNEPGYSQVQEQQPNSCSLDEKPEDSEAQKQYESLPAIARVRDLDNQLEDSYSDSGFGSEESAKQRQEDIDKDTDARNQPTISGPPNADDQQNSNADLANEMGSETPSPSSQTEPQESMPESNSNA